ncbi:hypothetical protein GCM10007276_12200 [Agaricicola taiwanensis]|uniref:Uncharacterized protein n=1 Tax=Agaricicola taiwanensis TaxID=591372 RepID=A0A8J2VPI4_9RHOB|nr:hypothetical protein [Agaricicola taiwanensis]GGE36273.1 hypothetical protein GCM10007276_12200 [Agaricicola taiwanensis]
MPAHDYAPHMPIAPMLRDIPALPTPDHADLERRVADLEERARKQDREAIARDRLKAMGLVLPARS